MSRFFPHTPYAEDQPLAKTILSTHVVARAVTAGGVIGMAVAGVRHSIPFLRRRCSAAPLGEKLLLTCSRSVVATVAVSAGAGLGARMYGREHIEWQDRSWRQLENRGQVETDDWTCAGVGAAAAAAALRGRAGPARLGWRGVTGAMGMGSVGGLVGYLAWRYGVNGGRFVEADKGERTGI